MHPLPLHPLELEVRQALSSAGLHVLHRLAPESLHGIKVARIKEVVVLALSAGDELAAGRLRRECDETLGAAGYETAHADLVTLLFVRRPPWERALSNGSPSPPEPPA